MNLSCCCSCNTNSRTDSSISNVNIEDDVTCCIFNCTKRDLIKSGFYCTKMFNNIICCGCGWQSGDVKLTIQHVNFLHKLHNPDCKMSKYVSGDFCNYTKYKQSVNHTEEVMLETYENWPKQYPISQDLVDVGLYYTGSDDAVACISCGVVLEDWSPEDKPYDKHRKASPLCELIKKYIC